MTFLETVEFTRQVIQLMEDVRYAEFQQALWENPHLGKVMPGCGGLRKARAANPRRQKGKRGGLRVIYLDIPEVDCILLLDIYGKDEKDDLTAAEKKVLKQLAQELKQEAVESLRQTEGNAE